MNHRNAQVLLLAGGSIILTVLLALCFRGTFLMPRPLKISDGKSMSLVKNGVGIRVWAKVRNDGAKGEVAMQAHVYFGEKTWSRTICEEFDAGEIKVMYATFAEPSLLDLLRIEHKVEIR